MISDTQTPLPTSRAAAVDAGSTYYVDAAGCRNEHSPAIRYTKTGECRLCAKDRAASYYRRNPDRWVEYKANNPERHAAHTARYRARGYKSGLQITLDREVQTRIDFRTQVCADCGVQFTEDNKPFAAHAEKMADGGKHEEPNLIPLCYRCFCTSLRDNNNARRKDT